MIVTYKSKSLEKICNDVSKAIRKYGADIAQKLYQRLNEIRAAINVELMIQYHIGRCHRLEGNRLGQYSVDLVHPYRLIFTVSGDEVQIAEIVEITDYH